MPILPRSLTHATVATLSGMLLTLLLNTAAFAQTNENTQQKIEDALNSEIRSAEDRARDPHRQPVEVLSFFGLRDDMRVIELLPFGGWYTKILGPVCGKTASSM